jgi:hypothetical protein
MTTERMAEQLAALRRMRWLLWGLTLLAVVVAWFAGVFFWGAAIIVAAFAIRNEMVIREGRRALRSTG